MASAKKVPARRIIPSRMLGEWLGKTSVISACSCILARSSVSSPMVMAWRPKPFAGLKFARRPCLRCFRNAAWYCRDNPFSLRFMTFPEFTGEPIYAFDRLIHQPLRAGNLFLEALGVTRRLLFQRQQSDIDSQ